MADRGGYIRTGLAVPVMNIIVLIAVDIALASLVTTLVRLANLLLMKRSVLREGRASVRYGACYKEFAILILVLTLGLAEFGIDGYSADVKERKGVTITGMFRSNSPPVTVHGDAESDIENEYAFYNTTRFGFTLSYKAGSGWVEAIKLSNCIFDRMRTKECADQSFNSSIPRSIEVKAGPMFVPQTKEYLVFSEAGHFFLTCTTFPNGKISDSYSCKGLLKLGGNKYKSFYTVMIIPKWANFSAGVVYPNGIDRNSSMYYNIELNPDLPGWCYGFPGSCSLRFALQGGTGWDSVRGDLMNGIANEKLTVKVEADVSSVVIRAQVALWAIAFLLASLILLTAILVLLKIVNSRHVIQLDLADVRNILQRKYCNDSPRHTEHQYFFWTLKRSNQNLWDICVDENVCTWKPDLHEGDTIL